MISVLLAVTGLACGTVFAGDQWPAGQLAQDNADFAFDFYQKLSSADGNLFFSPYSISEALAMVYGGAKGDTQQQMAKVLRFTQSEDKIHPAFSNLDRVLGNEQKDGKVTLSIANSLWPSDRYKFLDTYVDLLKKDYGVSITPLDYTKTEAARNTINKWVEDKTQNKIKDLIGPGALTADTKLTLVNAIYFYGKWLSAFDPKSTNESDFFLVQDKTEKVQMMSQTTEFPYTETDSFQMLELPYQGEDLSMLVILPKSKDGLKQIESGLSQKSLSEWRSKLVKTKVRLLFPKFKITWGATELNQQLIALGMSDAFDPSKANFAGMDGNSHNLYIGIVLHKAFIDVKEEGTEAAAATAVGIRSMAVLASQPPLFQADHPFFFLIQEKKTGSILFMGRVSDPKAGG